MFGKVWATHIQGHIYYMAILITVMQITLNLTKVEINDKLTKYIFTWQLIILVYHTIGYK